MAGTNQRPASGSASTTSRNRNRSPRPSAPNPAAVAHDLDEPRAQAARTPGHDEIAMLAFEIYLSRGECPGRDFEDWLEAERQLLSR